MFQELLIPLARSIKRMLVLAIIAIPVTYLIQSLTPSDITPWDEYKVILGFIWGFLKDWGGWIIVGVICLKFLKNLNTYYVTAEALRERYFHLEVQRWDHTPYIAPLHYWYIMSTPGAISPYLAAHVHNHFYQQVMNAFRERVFFNKQISNDDPLGKPSFLKVVGSKIQLLILVGLCTIGTYYYFMFQYKPDISEWYSGLDKFTLPLLVFLLSWTVQIIAAMVKYSRHGYYENLVHRYFGQSAPKITWREMFPDQPNGQDVIKVYEYAREQLTKNTLMLRNYPIVQDLSQYYPTVPNLPPYPFPKEQLGLEKEMEENIRNFKESERAKDEEMKWKAIKDTNKNKPQKGQVVEFTKKKKVY
jgi:hypothetical protein